MGPSAADVAVAAVAAAVVSLGNIRPGHVWAMLRPQSCKFGGLGTRGLEIRTNHICLYCTGFMASADLEKRMKNVNIVIGSP